jgi:hypothetical protein
MAKRDSTTALAADPACHFNRKIRIPGIKTNEFVEKLIATGYPEAREESITSRQKPKKLVPNSV